MAEGDPRRHVPAVHRVLAAYRDAGGTLVDESAVRAIRSALDERRTSAGVATADEITDAVVERLLGLERPRLRRVLNGTGVLLHTNLGRSPVSEAAARAMAETASGYVSLEIQLESGTRGGRMSEIERLLQAITGAEAALIVNNNAAAVLLSLSALASGREVIVSRGEAVEIGGGVRIPDVLAQSGATMIEVGTTNRTYPRDYSAAIGPLTGALLKVHSSNFRISGFVHAPSRQELAQVAHERGLPLIEDQGSGVLLDPSPFGLTGETPVTEALAAGVDLITMSGDKLIGGPQAGLIVGRRELVERCLRHPLARAVRADKATLAGMAETLRHYVRGEALTAIPVWRMIAAPVQSLFTRARDLRGQLAAFGVPSEIAAASSTIGGGSLPGETLPSVAMSFSAGDIDGLARRLRQGEPPVFGRIAEDRLLVDLRTILPEDDEALVQALAAALSA